MIHSRRNRKIPYEIIDEGIGLLFRFRGDIATKEIMAANTEGWEHPNWQKHQYQIWDYSGVGVMIMDEPDSLAFAKMDSVAFQNTLPMKIGFIAVSKQIIDLCETYVATLDAEKSEARVFSDEATARQWLEE
ncbi:MAG: hypothetical protein VCD33_17590 [Alphaproteobacteria bacterium]|jgi:hypothetical protein